MTDLVADQIQLLMPRGGADLIVGEVPAAQGIADIVGVRFDQDVMRHRMESGIGPITSPLKVRVLHSLRKDRAVRISTLAQRLHTSPTALTRSTLRPLAELGLVELNATTVSSTGVWRPIAAHVTAVELKLTKWRSALRQADNFAYSADRAWLVLDASRSAAAVREKALIQSLGVGLAVIRTTGELQVIVRPKGRRPERWLRSLMAEQVWAAAIADMAPVFDGDGLHQGTPPIEVTSGRNASGGSCRQAVSKSDCGVEAVSDPPTADGERYGIQCGSLGRRVADLVLFGERQIVRAAHRSAIDTSARLVVGLGHQLLMYTPWHGAQQLRLEVWERALLRCRHGRGNAVDPRPCGHSAAERPGAPTEG